MADKPIQTAAALKRRLSKYFAGSAAKYRDVFDLTNKLDSLGEVAIFGGALRDLYLNGSKHNPRDIDLVVDTKDVEGLEQILYQYECEKNKFGGYRLKVERWMVDVWPVSSTWAFRMGFVKGSSLCKLPETTFLTSDSILYLIKSSTVICSASYLKQLNSRQLDINLEHNPNPIGSVARAFRSSIQYNFSLSPKLVEFIVRHLKDISMREWMETLTNYLEFEINQLAVEETLAAMKQHRSREVNTPFQFDAKKWKRVHRVAMPGELFE